MTPAITRKSEVGSQGGWSKWGLLGKRIQLLASHLCPISNHFHAKKSIFSSSSSLPLSLSFPCLLNCQSRLSTKSRFDHSWIRNPWPNKSMWLVELWPSWVVSSILPVLPHGLAPFGLRLILPNTYLRSGLALLGRTNKRYAVLICGSALEPAVA